MRGRGHSCPAPCSRIQMRFLPNQTIRLRRSLKCRLSIGSRRSEGQKELQLSQPLDGGQPAGAHRPAVKWRKRNRQPSTSAAAVMAARLLELISVSASAVSTLPRSRLVSDAVASAFYRIRKKSERTDRRRSNQTDRRPPSRPPDPAGRDVSHATSTLTLETVRRGLRAPPAA